MVDSTEHLKAARAAFSRADWRAACDGFRAASERSELGAADLNALGDAAWWLGEVDAALTAYGFPDSAAVLAGRYVASALLFSASFMFSKPCLVPSSNLPVKGTNTPLNTSSWTKVTLSASFSRIRK